MLSENDPEKKCFTYLAENETLPSTRAAEEDGLHAFFGRIHAGEELDQIATAEAMTARAKANDVAPHPPITTHADSALESAKTWAKNFGTGTTKGNSKYARVLNCRFATLYFRTLSRLPAHFRATKDLVMSNVLARQESGFMGVSGSSANRVGWGLTSRHHEQLAACVISLSWDIFDETITPTSTGVRDLNRWDSIGLQAIDAAFQKRFGKYAESRARIGTRNHAYMEAMKTYAQDVKDASKGVQTRRRNAGQPEIPNFAEDIASALAWPNSLQSRTPYPFPTTSFVAWIFDVFATIPNAIREVSFD